MAYSVDNFSGSRTIVIEDGTIDSSLDVRLIGKNYAGYGEVQNENFVHLLENFAGNTPPTRPINGQIWYDTLIRKLKFYDSTVLTWRSTGGVEVGPTAPSGLVAGDLWFNSQTEQLYVNNGVDFTLVGPDGVAGFGTTKMESTILIDTNDVVHAAIIAYVDDEPMFTISRDDEYQLKAVSQVGLGGTVFYGVIKPGITLVNTNNSTGDTASARLFWGTASHALESDLSDVTLTVAGGTEKSVLYQTAPNVTDFVPSNISSTRKILSQIGNGTTASNPDWIILPTVLPIAKNDGSILDIPLSNGSFSVLKRTGEPVNIFVQ